MDIKGEKKWDSAECCNPVNDKAPISLCVSLSLSLYTHVFINIHEITDYKIKIAKWTFSR